MTKSFLKQAITVLLEKFGRMKVVVDSAVDAKFNLFLALETLYVGIEEKLCLWRAYKGGGLLRRHCRPRFCPFNQTSRVANLAWSASAWRSQPFSRSRLPHIRANHVRALATRDSAACRARERGGDRFPTPSCSVCSDYCHSTTCPYVPCLLRSVRLLDMRTVAVANQKGGVGKTTTVVNLAAALAEAGHPALVIDLDPQGSASQWLDVAPTKPHLADALKGACPLEKLVRPCALEGLEVIPSPGRALAEAELSLPGAVPQKAFSQALEMLPPRWEFVLVDCPPSLGLLAVNALTACREVLITVEASVMPLAGLRELMATVEELRRYLNPGLAIMGILACRVDYRTKLSREVVTRLRERFANLVLPGVVRENVRVAEAPSWHQPVTTYAPASSAAADYRQVASDLLQRSHHVPQQPPDRSGSRSAGVDSPAGRDGSQPADPDKPRRGAKRGRATRLATSTTATNGDWPPTGSAGEPVPQHRRAADHLADRRPDPARPSGLVDPAASQTRDGL